MQVVASVFYCGCFPLEDEARDGDTLRRLLSRLDVNIAFIVVVAVGIILLLERRVQSHVLVRVVELLQLLLLLVLFLL